MAKMFHEVTFYAVDTAEYLSTAKLRHIPKNVCVQIARDGLDHLPFSDQSFDYVMCRFLSFRITNWRSLVDEMVRLTKPGWFVFYLYIDTTVCHARLTNQKSFKVL
jgi:ubiquinone/menaquinone biosynthesis C-methylase UbiE